MPTPDALTAAMDAAVSALEDHAARTGDSRPITIVHHNDTDGLTSGAILVEAFERSGYTTRRFSLEKPYPQVLESLLRGHDGIVVFADFAGKIAPFIAKLNGGRNLILILDHHPAEDTADPTVWNLDGDLFGLKGDRDISGSATCYLFAQILLERHGSSAADLAHLGALGAVGDGFFVDGALSGVNRTILDVAQSRGTMRAQRWSGGERYTIRVGGTEHAAADMCSILDTVGGVGYYDDGPSKGVQICRTGLSRTLESYAQRLATMREDLFQREIARLEHNVQTTEHLQWFDLASRFRPMGVKMVGVFCVEIKELPFLDQTKYLAGFQHVPDEVPGFGSIPFHATKISMRVSHHMTERIRNGRSPGLDSFLPEATHRLGGFADACHSLSAATTVKIGEEHALIREIESVLRERTT